MLPLWSESLLIAVPNGGRQLYRVKSSQKEKNKYCILMHIHGISKDGTDASYLQGSNGDADIENKLVDTGRGRNERVGRMERAAWKHVHYHV